MIAGLILVLLVVVFWPVLIEAAVATAHHHEVALVCIGGLAGIVAMGLIGWLIWLGREPIGW